MLEAWLSFGYIVLLAVLLLAFILWRRNGPVLAIASLVVGIPLWFGWEYARPTWTTGFITGTEVRRSDPDATAALEERIIDGPKGWGALGASDPTERTRTLDRLGFSLQLVHPFRVLPRPG